VSYGWHVESGKQKNGGHVKSGKLKRNAGKSDSSDDRIRVCTAKPFWISGKNDFY
jgi:hypothetical protein